MTTSLHSIYSQTLLDDPRRTWEVDPALFVEVAIRTLLEPELRAAHLTRLEDAAKRSAQPDEATRDALAAGIADVEPEELVAILTDLDRFAGACDAIEVLVPDADALEAAAEAAPAAADTADVADDTDAADDDTETSDDDTATTDTATDEDEDTTETDGADSDDATNDDARADEGDDEGDADDKKERRDAYDPLAALDSIGAPVQEKPKVDAASSDETDEADQPDAEAAATSSETDADDGDDEEGDAKPALGPAVPASSPAIDVPDSLVHARDVDSVLFSLKNLDAVREEKGEKGALPTTEGSGLLDVKALVAEKKRRKKEAGTANRAHEVWSEAVLPVPNMQLGTRKRDTWLKVAVAAAAVLFIALIGVVIYFMAKDEPEQQQTVAQNAAEVDDDAIKAPDLGVGGVPQGQSAANNQAAAEGEAPSQGAAEEGEGEGTPDDGGADGTPTDGEGGEKVADADGEAKAKAASSSRSSAKRDDDDKKKSRSSRSSRRSKKSGKTLTKAQVQRVIRKNFSKVRQCSRDADVKGKLKIRFTIKGSGRVSGVRVASSEFKGSRVGKCVVRVVKSFRFPDYGGDSIPVTYPFHIN